MGPSPLFKKHFLSCVGLIGMISVNWNLENIFLCFPEFVCSLIGRAWQRVKGHYHPTVRWLVFLGTPQDTLLLRLKTGDVHKHITEDKSYCTGQRLRPGETLSAFRVTLYIVIFLLNLCFYLSLNLLPHFLSLSLTLSQQSRV